MELQIRQLSKTYTNGIRALHDINLTIPAGMYGLLGPNGAGKSTLMRTLATLQDPDSGSARLCPATDGGTDLDIIGQKEELRKTLGYLPQEFGLYPKVSALSLLGHFAVLKGVCGRTRHKSVETLLRKVNLWEARHQKLGGYSGGMRQRFGVAVALLGTPKLLIVDEPTAGLDPAERMRFLNLLSELGEQSIVILSTHIIEDVAALCTKMAIINNGQILLEKQPREATAALTGKIWRKQVPKQELSALELTHRIVSTKLYSGKVQVQVYSDAHPGPGFAMSTPDLEDVYFCAIAGHIGISSTQKEETP